MPAAIPSSAFSHSRLPTALGARIPSSVPLKSSHSPPNFLDDGPHRWYGISPTTSSSQFTNHLWCSGLAPGSLVSLKKGDSLDARMGPISIAQILMKYESRKQIQEVYNTVFSTFSKVEVLSILVEVVLGLLDFIPRVDRCLKIIPTHHMSSYNSSEYVILSKISWQFHVPFGNLT